MINVTNITLFTRVRKQDLSALVVNLAYLQTFPLGAQFTITYFVLHTTFFASNIVHYETKTLFCNSLH